MFSEKDDSYWLQDIEPTLPSAVPPDQFLPGFYGDTSGADVYDDAGRDYWNPMYEPGGYEAPPTSTPGYNRYAGMRWQGKEAAKGGRGMTGTTPTQYRPPTGSTSVSTTTPSGPRPELGDVPTLEVMPYDKRRVRALTQKIVGPQMAGLRRQYQLAALTVSSENPNVTQRGIGEALAAYGIGAGAILGRGGAAARDEYMRERHEESRVREANWRAEVNRENMEFQTIMNAWLGTAQRTTTQTYQYADRGGGEGGGDGGGSVSLGI